MNKIKLLTGEVAEARKAYLQQIEELTDAQAQWKPDAETWSVVDNTEHLFWAEHGAIAGMWKTLHAIRNGQLPRTYEFIHKDLPIDEVIRLTWQEKEKVPAVAAPRFGGPIKFWLISLEELQKTLEAFGNDIQEDELRVQAHPHPISGPLDFHQRLEFLKFHLDRHRKQVKDLFNVKR